MPEDTRIRSKINLPRTCGCTCGSSLISNILSITPRTGCVRAGQSPQTPVKTGFAGVARLTIRAVFVDCFAVVSGGLRECMSAGHFHILRAESPDSIAPDVVLGLTPEENGGGRFPHASALSSGFPRRELPVVAAAGRFEFSRNINLKVNLESRERGPV